MGQERIERHPFVPPIYDTWYPKEIRPGEQTYLRFLEHRVLSLLEDLTYAKSQDDLSERFDYYIKEQILLSRLTPAEMNPNERIRLDTLEAVLNFVGDEVVITTDSAQQAYQDCVDFIEKNEARSEV